MGAPFKRKRWREAQRLRVDVNGMLAHLIGDAGLTDADLESMLPRLLEARDTLERQRRAGKLGMLRLDVAAREARGAVALAGDLRGRFDDLVILGRGAAARAVGALAAAAVPPARPAEDAMRVHALTTLEPGRFAAAIGALDLRRTLFDVISASGDSPDTLGQFLVVRDRLLKDLGAVEYKQHVVVTTGPAAGAFRQIVNDEGFRDLTIDPEVEGRVAILGAAGLFPLACAGVDPAEVLAGAADLEARAAAEDPRVSPVLLHAGVLHLLAATRGPHGLTVRGYGEALTAIATWFADLWTASAGAGAATAPSARDQDAADAVVLFLCADEYPEDVPVPRSYEDLEAVAYLGGSGLGALLVLEQQADEVALGMAGRPSSTVRCPHLSPFAIGQVVHLLALDAALVRLLSEPRAAAADRERAALAAGLAGRPGLESRRADTLRWLGRKEARYVV